ncbi:MAG: metal-dependent hydrolase [Halodesulfurarchaeum sp.]
MVPSVLPVRVMMATTHVLVGVGIAAVASLVAPDFSLLSLVAAAAGGVVPDLDLYAGHRKTLHYPVYYSVASLFAGGLYMLSPSPIRLALALFLIAAGTHSFMDAFGGGLELRPWQGTSDRAVYSHYHGRWLRPRRWIPYDGAPSDLGLAILVSLPALFAFDGQVSLAIGGLLLISGVYVALRKPLVWVATWLYDRVPDSLRGRLPERFVQGLS